VAFAIPGGIVTMVGVVLAVQSATGLWATWAYAWALVAPGGVGAGMLLYGIIAGQRDIARTGVPIVLTGLGLFLGFGLFFEGILHLSGPDLPVAEPALAVGLVLLGVVVILSAFVGGRRRA
jgi:hydrogenase/urease accessory protein HupE